MKRFLFIIVLWLVLCPVVFATATPPVIVTPDTTTVIKPPADSVITHTYSTTASVVYTIEELSWQTDISDNISVVDSGNGGGKIRFVPVAGQEGFYSTYLIATDTATGDNQGLSDTVIVYHTVSDTSKHFPYVITEVNNDPEHARLVCNNGSIHSVGNLIQDSIIANSTAILPSIPIDKFSSYYTISKAKLMQTSDTCHYVIFAQVSMDAITWVTADSSCPTIGDSTTYSKTWTLPKYNYFRPIIYGRRANDSCWVFITNIFVK